jgi:hypothetical protein
MTDLKKILDTMLGKKDAEIVRKTISEAQKTLDGAGVQRKAEGEEGGETAAGGEAILSAVESAGAPAAAALVKNILDALKGEALTALEEKLGSNEAVVTLLLKAVSAPPEESPAEEPPMAEGEMMKSLKDYIASTTKDMGDMARANLDMAKALREIAGQSKELQSRLEKLEGQINDRPRQASKADETVVVGTDDTAKKALEASLGETTVIAGIRVKKEAPNGKR